MIEDKNNIELSVKKVWNSPDLFQLDFKKTLGGESSANYEDAYNHDPAAGSQ